MKPDCDVAQRIRDIYQQSDRIRAASLTLDRINTQARESVGLATPDGTLFHAERDAIAQFFGLQSGHRLLDVGCGTGVPLAAVVERSGCQGIGLDVSLERLSVAQARGIAHKGDLSLLSADVSASLPFASQSFDAAMQLDSIIHVADKQTLLRELARVLKPRARFVICSTVGTELTLEQARAMGETPDTLFRVTSRQLAALIRAARFQLIAQRERHAQLLRWHSLRLEWLDVSVSQLAAEIGPVETERILTRTRTLVDLLASGVVDSTLVFAEKLA